MLEAKVATMMRRLPALAEQAAHPFRNRLLGRGKAGALCVGGIRQQSQHAPAAVLGNGGQVGDGVTGQRRIVDLEVTGMDDHAGRAVDGKGQRIRDGVVDMDGFHGKAAQRDLLAGADLMEDGAGRQTMLLQLVF